MTLTAALAEQLASQVVEAFDTTLAQPQKLITLDPLAPPTGSTDHLDSA